MRRRSALAALLCVPLCAIAQARIPRVGVLEVSAPGSFPLRLRAFEEGMRERGFVEGRNVHFEYRWGSGRVEDMPRLAAELVERKVDVIFAPTTVSALAARKATATLPIVFAVPADPAGVGLVETLARPAGNATGLTTGNIEIVPKRLEILKEISGAAVVGVLFNPDDASNLLLLRSAEQVGPRLGVRVHPLRVSRRDDLPAAFALVPERGIGALLVAAGAMMDGNRAHIVALAARARVPALYSAREFVEAGGLASYSASFADNYRRAAGYVERILKGARPGELPVEQASRFDFLINMQAARALGIRIPPDMLVRASEVVE